MDQWRRSQADRGSSRSGSRRGGGRAAGSQGWTAQERRRKDGWQDWGSRWWSDRSYQQGHVEFGGGWVHFVQIGLGTNTTFVQNLVGCWEDWSYSIAWLMNAASEQRRGHVCGVAVEPVGHLAQAYQRLAESLPNVEVLQAAISDTDEDNAEVHFLSDEDAEALLSQVAPSMTEDLAKQLVFIKNMSTVGRNHPELKEASDSIEIGFGVRLPLSVQRVDIWSYGRLAQSLNFVGCEILMIDAEGHDASILRSVMEHCRHYPSAWPWLIQFETMGNCDKVEGNGTEWSIIHQLEDAGYLLVGYSHGNTHMAWQQALRYEKRLQKWVRSWKCKCCQRRELFPYVTTRNGVWCQFCLGLRRSRHKRKRQQPWRPRGHQRVGTKSMLA